MQRALKKKRFIALDGMRGVAAIAVMLYHFAMGTPHPLFQNGYIAVDIFFALSGFVVMHAYGKKLMKGMKPLEYMKKRIARLYPLFFLGLVLGSLAFVASTALGHSDYTASDQLKAFLCNLFMFPFFNHGHIYSHDGMVEGVIFPANNPLWSLFFEMMASIAFIWVVRVRTRTLLFVMLACFSAIVLEGLLLAHRQHSAGLVVGLGWGGMGNFVGGFPRVFYSFTGGIVIYRLRARIAGALSRLRWMPALAVYGLLALIVFIPVKAGGLYYLVMAGAAAPMLILLGAYASAGKGMMLKLSEFLGWISYPLYCLHYPVGNFVQWVNERYALQFSEASLLALSCVLAFGLSILAGLYFEPRGKILVENLLTRLIALLPISGPARQRPLQPLALQAQTN